MRELRLAIESFPIRGAFSISRGSKIEARVVTVELREADARGRGECVPYARYGETAEGVRDTIESLRSDLEAGLDRPDLQSRLPRGAARNALDCALWDLEAKRTGCRVWQLAGLDEPAALTTAYTISLGSPAAMAAAAGTSDRPLLKLKLGGDADLDRVRAVRVAAPRSRLIVDANEAWSLDTLMSLAPELAALGVELIEQPLSAADDRQLQGIQPPIPLCADESCHDRASLAALGAYAFINVKLDKTGGLTAALDLIAAARQTGYGIMVGCMVATSLSMAPATLLASQAAYVDLDGPLLLERDRDPALHYEGSLVPPVRPDLWG